MTGRVPLNCATFHNSKYTQTSLGKMNRDLTRKYYASEDILRNAFDTTYRLLERKRSDI
jgi:hypothetical protein